MIVGYVLVDLDVYFALKKSHAMRVVKYLELIIIPVIYGYKMINVLSRMKDMLKRFHIRTNYMILLNKRI